MTLASSKLNEKILVTQILKGALVSERLPITEVRLSLIHI